MPTTSAAVGDGDEQVGGRRRHDVQPGCGGATGSYRENLVRDQALDGVDMAGVSVVAISTFTRCTLRAQRPRPGQAVRRDQAVDVIITATSPDVAIW